MRLVLRANKITGKYACCSPAADYHIAELPTFKTDAQTEADHSLPGTFGD